ncbi:Programmed cell death protein 7 [Acanthosepion pharaonis]|uniref:Programmed cell death protein 7 n=1 Tax=Acanthosepion pharaonis TaxID=158019 RepID=A0A812CMC8_ACAPH|nr:Programmed cell death protein 7 [Sepia pharaonis]
MPLYRHPLPPSVPPPPRQHLIAHDRNNSFHHATVPPPPQPPAQSSRVGGYDNLGWNVPDSTHQSCNQNVFPPVPPSNFPNTSLPPPPLSMYPTDTNQVAPVPPIKTPSVPYSRPQQVLFVGPNPSCPPPPPPLPNAACPPPPPLPPVVCNQNNLNSNNSRSQITSSLQSNIPVPQPGASSFIPATPTPSNTNLNIGPSPPIPSQDLLITLPPNFNVPPPNLPTLNNNITVQQQSCESVVKETDKDAAVDIQKQEDQSWINQRFLCRKRCLPQSTTKKEESITISEAQKLIREMFILAAQLQQQTQNLELITATASKDEWLKEVKKTEAMKEQLEQFRHKVDNQDLMAQLEKKVKKRQKDRERLKRSQSRRYQEKQEALARRNELHSQIDEWLNAISQKEIQLKKDKEMKICVDSVLSEVRKKKSDVSKMLELIKVLSKLRKVRKENVAKKGLYTLFHCDQKFEEDIPRLQRMLNRQMEIYEAEQRTLMVMLECEQEETKERERAHSHKVQAEIEKREQKREQQLLFGKRTIDDDDPIYPFMKFYSQAEYSWEAFIQIRRDWDSYLVPENTPGASRIPNSWVMPPEPSDAIWAKFLET